MGCSGAHPIDCGLTACVYLGEPLIARRQHYLPKFYLKGFECASGRIHLFSLNSRRPIRNAKLKTQCYKRGFYGADGEIETALSGFENHVAPILQAIRADGLLPGRRTSDWRRILEFVGLQSLRTLKSEHLANQFVDKLIKQIHWRDPRFIEQDLERAQFGFDHAALFLMQHLAARTEGFSDLKRHVLVANEKSFFASDNPVFLYNQYCEGIDRGTTGSVLKGLQVFFPLSPRFCLVLYDPAIYDTGFKAGFAGKSIASNHDVDALNEMQIIAAHQNVYFAHWSQRSEFRRLLPGLARHRDGDEILVREFGQEDDPDSSLIAIHQPSPNLNLNLDFLRVRGKASKIPIQDRFGPRKAWNNRMRTATANGRSIRFTRFLGQR